MRLQAVTSAERNCNPSLDAPAARPPPRWRHRQTWIGLADVIGTGYCGLSALCVRRGSSVLGRGMRPVNMVVPVAAGPGLGGSVALVGFKCDMDVAVEDLLKGLDLAPTEKGPR
jgi:hypothetical protein